MGCRCQLGQGLGQSTGSIVGSTTGGALLTAAPFTGPAAPFVAAAGAAIGFFSSVFKFGYNPEKLNDTAVTEAFRIGMNTMWNNLTGDSLPTACDPGQCGRQRVSIFEQSRYPNVPYPAGQPGTDLNQYFAALEAAYLESRKNLVRSESQAGLTQNYQTMKDLLTRVAAERARSQSPLDALTSIATGQIPRTAEGGVDFWALAPWAAGGYLLYKFL